MASAETPEQVIQRIAGLLDTAGIPYMLTGSFASGFYGSPRASQDIDLIVRKSRPFSVTEFDRRTQTEFAAATIYVATAEDVLIAKLEWAKLSESERQLEDAGGIIRMQGQELDLGYVERWVQELDLSEQWARAKSKVN
jgi:hypothetical protein